MVEITLKDLISQEVKRAPSTYYAHLREQDPFSYLADFNGVGPAWIATCYDDVLAILKDPRFVKDPLKVPALTGGEPLTFRGASADDNIFKWRRDMLLVDPPDHGRLRNLVSKAFSPRMIEQLRPRIQQIADDLLDTVQDKDQMDLINDFAFPLPITVISELLGIPVEDRPQFRIWTQALLTTFDDPNTDAMRVFPRYIQTLLAEKRKHPGNDLTSGLVRAEENGDTLSENELMSTIFLLIVAGHETTVNLIGTGTLMLLQHPEQMHLLQADPSLIASAIEELLRYTAPVSLSTPRWASEDIIIHDHLIKKGDMMFVSLIAANTDAQHFDDPDVLDITRQENQHLAFGKGIHFCLGAPLARLEGQIAFSTLLRRLPDIRLAGDPDQLTWTRTPILRGLTSLPVTFHHRTA